MKKIKQGGQKMNYGIVIFPPKELQDELNEYRKRYDSHYSLIPPHITLKYAHSISILEQEVERITNICHNANSFTLQTKGINTFFPTTNVVYLSLEKSEEIFKLRDQLHEENNPIDQKFPFVPHLTIGQDLNEVELHDILGELKMKQLKYTFLVDRLHLLYQLENGIWSVYQTFLLK